MHVRLAAAAKHGSPSSSPVPLPEHLVAEALQGFTHVHHILLHAAATGSGGLAKSAHWMRVCRSKETSRRNVCAGAGAQQLYLAPRVVAAHQYTTSSFLEGLAATCLKYPLAAVLAASTQACWGNPISCQSRIRSIRSHVRSRHNYFARFVLPFVLAALGFAAFSGVSPSVPFRMTGVSGQGLQERDGAQVQRTSIGIGSFGSAAGLCSVG